MAGKAIKILVENSAFLIVLLLGIGVAALVFSHMGLPAHHEQDERHNALRERVAVLEQTVRALTVVSVETEAE